MSLAQIARKLGGEACGAYALVPGPGHSTKDRSLKVWYDDEGEIRVHSFAGDDWRDCRDYLRRQGVLEDDGCGSYTAPHPREPHKPAKRDQDEAAETARNQEVALRIWGEASDPRGTVAETYLRSRGVELPPTGAEAIRFAPSLMHRPSGDLWPCMVALVTDAASGNPVAIHRTYLRQDGLGKAPVVPDKMTLGPCRGGVVRLVADEDIEQRLAVGEGIESCLSMIKGGWRTWSLLSASNFKSFPFMPGVDLTIAADHDVNGAGQDAAESLARRWATAGGWADVILPRDAGTDMNDLVLGEVIL